jgi:hypothetical protein
VIWFSGSGRLALQLIEWLRVGTVSHKEVAVSLKSIVAEKHGCINEIVRLWESALLRKWWCYFVYSLRLRNLLRCRSSDCDKYS